MLGLPCPYPEELIYSLLARAGLHYGIESPKALLDEIYGDRRVVATIDLPCRLAQIAAHYPETLSLDAVSLIYRHTLFPLYAPFIEEPKRQSGIRWMSGASKGAIHAAFGLVASRVKALRTLHYCPWCVAEQLRHCGEIYWQRLCQVSGADICPKHGVALRASGTVPHQHRHAYLIPEIHSEDRDCEVYRPESEVVTRFASALLSLHPQVSPTYHQWSCFYRDLAHSADCQRGSHVLHQDISARVNWYWSHQWLANYGLALTSRDTSWSRAILRKHRKSFSFLQHLVMITALSGEEPHPESVLAQVKQYPLKPQLVVSTYRQEEVNIRERRKDWLIRLKTDGCQQARKHHSGALYAWLYRHDRAWLLRINRRYQRSHVTVNKRVDWQLRDKVCVRHLMRLLPDVRDDLAVPRLSSAYYIHRSIMAASVLEKHLDKLPRTRSFLNGYTESVGEYQIRRLTNAALSVYRQQLPWMRWRLLRTAGLSEERLTPLAGWFLKGVTEGLWENIDFNISPKMR